MSHTAHIPSHRKPRRSASKLALRAGVAGGVLSTLAVAAAAGTANAAEPVTETIEMPTLTADLATQVASPRTPPSRPRTTTSCAPSRTRRRRRPPSRPRQTRPGREEGGGQEEGRGRRARQGGRGARLALLRAHDLCPPRRASHVRRARPGQRQRRPVISFLKAQLGNAYVMGATGPNAWDCSGLAQAAFKQAASTCRASRRTSRRPAPQVGAVATSRSATSCTGRQGSAYHVGVYIGGGQYLDAANPGKGVVIQDLSGYPARAPCASSDHGHAGPGPAHRLLRAPTACSPSSALAATAALARQRLPHRGVADAERHRPAAPHRLTPSGPPCSGR